MDRRIQELERRWRESGLAADRAAWLRERMRMGELPPEKLQLAAAAGDAGACVALGWPERTDPFRLARILAPLGRLRCARIAAAAVETVLPGCPTISGHAAPPLGVLADLWARIGRREPPELAGIALLEAARSCSRGRVETVWRAIEAAHMRGCGPGCGVLRAMANLVNLVEASADQQCAEHAVDTIRAAQLAIDDDRDAAARLIAATLAQATPG